MERLFHYTSREAAESIIEEVQEYGPYFYVGTGSVHGHGLYATGIEPRDAGSMQEVSSRCFNGAATELELDHVLVLLAGNAEHSFAQTSDPDVWLISAQPLEVIALDTLLLEIKRFEHDVGWRTVWENEVFSGESFEG